MAAVMAQRGTCPYVKVGAIIAREGRILSSGYNGAPSGMQHCIHGPRMDDEPVKPCLTAVHAESNAIAFAARHGNVLGWATMYTTLTPCRQCAQLIIQSGIERVVSLARYRDSAGEELLTDAEIPVEVYP